MGDLEHRYRCQTGRSSSGPTTRVTCRSANGDGPRPRSCGTVRRCHITPSSTCRRSVGFRVSAEAAADDAHFASLLDLAAATAVNALVFDTKQEGGLGPLRQPSWRRHNEIGAVEPLVRPASPRSPRPARPGSTPSPGSVAFEDSFRSGAFTEEQAGHRLARPDSPSAARTYNLDLAVEACDAGVRRGPVRLREVPDGTAPPRSRVRGR